jgi:hypothetical protein
MVNREILLPIYSISLTEKDIVILSLKFKLGEIMNYFPGFQSEYDSILLKLKQLSEQSTWWKDERNIEVHLDMS